MWSATRTSPRASTARVMWVLSVWTMKHVARDGRMKDRCRLRWWDREWPTETVAGTVGKRCACHARRLRVAVYVDRGCMQWMYRCASCRSGR